MNKTELVKTGVRQAPTTINSREVAEMVGVGHKELLKKIRKYCAVLAESKIALGDFFIETEYLDANNQSRPCYEITRRGCDMVANKMTGEKGILFTASYVEAFNKMEQLDKDKSTMSYKDVLLKAIQSVNNSKIS